MKHERAHIRGSAAAGLPVLLALNQSPGMRGSGAWGSVAFGGAVAGSCWRLQPKAPAPAAKRGLRADKHFLPPRLGGLGGDAVVSGSGGAAALVKARQGPVWL